MGIRVCKFGGSSVADAEQLRKVRGIIEARPDRRFVVPSAPGKRFKDDEKVTDSSTAPKPRRAAPIRRGSASSRSST
jgi:aspartokinase